MLTAVLASPLVLPKQLLGKVLLLSRQNLARKLLLLVLMLMLMLLMLLHCQLLV